MVGEKYTKEEAIEEILENPIAFRRRTFLQEGDSKYVEHDIILHSCGRLVLDSGAVFPKNYSWADGQIIGPSARLQEVRICSFKKGQGNSYTRITYEDGRKKIFRL
ncbi:MAG: hypothetical protein QXD13_00190 [Candidatus Pacearchaeota archaeon]